MNPVEIFIIGGGYSIKEGISLGLKDKMKNKFVIALNKSIEVFPDSTFLNFVDKETFYKKNKEELKKYTLIIGRHTEDLFKEKLPNTLLLKHTETYDRTLKSGVYGSFLVGLFALSLAIYLIDEGTIYLLGFDGGQLPPKPESLTIPIVINNRTIRVPAEDVTDKIINEKSANYVIKIDGKLYRVLSHFYQGEIEHRGIGKIEFYTKNDKVNKLFAPFKEETKCKIFNVSPDSNLNIFTKIDYGTMFAQMNNIVFNQNELRVWCINKLGGLK